MFIISEIKPFRRIKQFIELLCSGAFRQPWFQLFFCLVIMGTHWVYFETWSGISPVKVWYMCLCGFLLLGMGQRINKTVLMIMGVFYVCVLLSAYVFSDGVFSFQSIGYMLMFLCTYGYYISLLYSEAVSYEQCIRFLRGMIFAHFFFIVLQQVTAIIHLPIPILNCHGYLWGWKFPGMNIEPSHSSRVLATIFIVFIEMLHLRNSQARSFRHLWVNERPALCAFVYSMCTMGSGMGMAALGLIMLYLLFFTRHMWFVGASIVCLIVLLLIRDTEAFTRFHDTFLATATMDEKMVLEADRSAAARVNIILGTAKNIDIFDWNFWVGYGRNTGINMTGVLKIYGAVAFMAQVLLLWCFAWRSIVSIEVLFFIVFLSLAVGNVAYVWTIMMYWSMLKYFTKVEHKRDIRVASLPI